MKKILSALIGICFMTALLAGCATGTVAPSGTTSAPATGDDARLRIVTSIFPHYDFARAVAGDLVDVSMLIKPGTESHSFDPAPADMIAVQEADIFIYTGGHNEAWVDTLLGAVDTSNLVVLRMMDYVHVVEEELVEGMQSEDTHAHEEEPEESHIHPEEEPEHGDEHIWTSPLNAIRMVESVQQALSGARPALASEFTAAAATYIEQLQALDTSFREIVETAQRKLIVFGDRFPFRYFADEYGLEYRAAFPGCSTDSNPSAGTVAYLIDTVNEYNLPYIYIMELSTGSIARVISEETGCDVLTLESCHNLTAEQFEAGETYLTLMQQNAETLRKGLN